MLALTIRQFLLLRAVQKIGLFLSIVTVGFLCYRTTKITNYSLWNGPTSTMPMNCSRLSRNVVTTSYDAEEIFEQMYSSKYRVRFDASQQYAITEFAMVGENWKTGTKSSSCLATQGSITYLHHLLPLSRHWQGLVSVAVFVPGDDFRLTVLHIENMRRCYPDIMANVTFHFVSPVDHPPVDSLESPLLDIDDCSEEKLNVRNLTRFNYTSILFPQNTLRNVASKTCPTQHVLVMDIDMVPSLGLASQLDAFLANASPCRNCAYVVPAYEVSENAGLPTNKAELLDLISQKLSRPYRQEAFSLNQGATNSTLWEELSNGDYLDIGYRLACFKFFYEPFYVTGGPVPLFDERFVGYGFTRNTQAYETQLAGFQFFVLNEAFIVQHNMVKTPYESPGRKQQVEQNSKLYSKIKKEFEVKYPKVDKLPCASHE